MNKNYVKIVLLGDGKLNIKLKEGLVKLQFLIDTSIIILMIKRRLL